MSSTLILNAGTASPVNLVVTGAGENAPTEIGLVTPSFNGADRSSVRAVKRNFGTLTTYLSTADKDAVINLLKNGRQLPCSGELLGDIQTQCTMRYTGARMVPGLVPTLWEVGLTGNEVQPNNILLRYSPGDTITGESFTRSTVAYQLNNAGNLASVAINVKRDGHYVTTSSPRSILLEDTRTNWLIWANDFNNAAWVKTFIGITTGIADPTGGTTACTLTASAGPGDIQQRPADSTSIVRTGSVWLKRRTGSGTIQIRVTGTGAFTTVAVSSSWNRFSLAGAATTVRELDIRLNTSGDAIDAWCGQLEDGAFASSEIPTTAVAVTRGADSYSLPFTTPPQEMTVYAKFVELGTTLGAGGARLWQISDADSGVPQHEVYDSAGVYNVYHNNAATEVVESLAAAPAYGNTDEILTHLYGDGSIDITQSVNGAASTASPQSVACALSSAWAAQLVWLNSEGTVGNKGYVAIQKFVIASGARSLAEMRNL